MEPWHFDKHRAAVIVVDMENDFLDEGAVMEVPMARAFLPNMQAIVKAARRAGVPVVFTRHVLYDHFDVAPLEFAYIPKLRAGGVREGTRGTEIVSALAPLPGEPVIVKHRPDAFHNTQLDTILRNLRGAGGVDTLVIIGTLTSICCESTARAAYMRDYKVMFVSDANGDIDKNAHEATLRVLPRIFARIADTNAVVSMLSG
jgi:ureidoacrylate peracid hydrolase